MLSIRGMAGGDAAGGSGCCPVVAIVADFLDGWRALLSAATEAALRVLFCVVVADVLSSVVVV